MPNVRNPIRRWVDSAVMAALGVGAVPRQWAALVDVTTTDANQVRLPAAARAWIAGAPPHEPLTDIAALHDEGLRLSFRLIPYAKDQMLLVVRNHWGIENDCFWSLGAQFGEDDHPWVTTGRALSVLGVLRLMAYNVLQWARKRHLRHALPSGRLTDPPSWKSLFRWVEHALCLTLDPAAGPQPAS